MARVMMSLGGFTFELETLAHQKLVYSQSWRWPEQARITRDSALQFVGRNPGEIDLDGVIYPTFKGDLADVESLRGMADAGKPQMLVDGMGRVLGKWVIVEVGDTRTVFVDDGRARKVEFRIKLKYYGEDG
jgi:phage protein U